MAREGVVGTAVTVDATGRAAVGVLVRSGGVSGLPRVLDGVPVVVLVTGEIHARHHRPGHCDGPPGSPLPPGCGGGGAGITVNPTSGLTTSEGGGSDTFTVVLDSQPSEEVTIALSSSDVSEGTPSPTSLTFTPADWSSAQTVTVTGVDDAVADGDMAYTIVTGAAVSSDPAYGGLDPADVQVTNLDDEGEPTLPDCQASGQTTVKCARPVPLGVSGGHPDISAGTIGALLTDGTGVYILTNNHVAAETNQASFGDPYLQPGAYDGGIESSDSIGTLAAYVPIDFGGTNRVDAAAVATTEAATDNATPNDGYGTPSSTTDTVVPNDRALKYGRTTKQTECRVWGTNATVNVNYGDVDEDGDDDVATFVEQIVFLGGGCSKGGDSGSLFVKKSNNRPVGLLFAGSSNTTIANPIDAVLNELGATLRATLTVDGS